MKIFPYGYLTASKFFPTGTSRHQNSKVTNTSASKLFPYGYFSASKFKKLQTPPASMLLDAGGVCNFFFMPDPGFLGVYDPNFSEYLYATCDISKSSELDAESKSRAFRPLSWKKKILTPTFLGLRKIFLVGKFSLRPNVGSRWLWRHRLVNMSGRQQTNLPLPWFSAQSDP